jgi:hypothetical protein
MFAVAIFSPLPPASTASAQAEAHPDFSGFWQLRYDNMNVPLAKLTAKAKSADMKAMAANDLHVVRFCNHVGMPALMDRSSVLDIRESARELSILPEAVSPVRHIYTDGRPVADVNIVDPTTVGYSVGRWVGDTLVVDTRDFDAHGLLEIPGGGYRTADSHLLESYRLVENGANLEVTFTWTDPGVFAEPHTYSYRYARMGQDYRAVEWYCDPGDNNRAHFLIDAPKPVVWPDGAKQ